MSENVSRISIDNLLSYSSPHVRRNPRQTRRPPDGFKVKCKYHGCDRKFASIEHLKAHHRRQHAAPTSFICKHCHTSFSTGPNRNKHVSSFKINFAWNTTLLDRMQRLSVCSFIRKNLPRIILVWINPIKFSLSLVFLTLTSRKIRSVHEKKKPFSCESCGLSFGFRDGLQRHKEMVHSQLRPFICQFCEMKFKTKAHLTCHCFTIHADRVSKNTQQ